MTVAAVEAPEAVTAARARVARRPRRLPSPAPRDSARGRKAGRARTRGPAPSAPRARAGAFERGAALPTPGRSRKQTTFHVEEARRHGQEFRGHKAPAFNLPTQRSTRTNYQPVILAEFVAAILLTSLTPIAAKKGEPGLSPYEGKDMVKLGALTVLYLILALLSTGGRGPGKVAAWSGGLILLVVGINEAANIAATLDIFGGGMTKKASETPIGPGGPAPKK
jgi:hypothetical protein